MEIKIFRVIAEQEVIEIDCDYVPYEIMRTFYDDMFSTRVAAIRMAQKLRAWKKCYVRVLKVTITERGVSDSKCIYIKHF